MAFTQVACTGQITLPNGQAAVGALVEAVPSAAMTNNGITVSQPMTTVTDANGNFSIVLPANDDGATLPTGTFYTIKVHIAGSGQGSGIYQQWPVTISQAYAPTVNLLSLPHLTNPTSSLAELASLFSWQGGVPYRAGMFTVQSGILYQRNGDGTTAASWLSDQTNWTPLTIPGVELGYAQITAASAAVGTSVTDVSGLAITFIAPSRPVLLEFWAYSLGQFTSTGTPFVELTDSNNVQVGQANAGSIAGGAFSPTVVCKSRLSTLTAGQSYTYKVRLATTAATCEIVANPAYPSYLRAASL